MFLFISCFNWRRAEEKRRIEEEKRERRLTNEAAFNCWLKIKAEQDQEQKKRARETATGGGGDSNANGLRHRQKSANELGVRTRFSCFFFNLIQEQEQQQYLKCCL